MEANDCYFKATFFRGWKPLPQSKSHKLPLFNLLVPMTYLFDTKMLKLYRLEGNQSVEIDNPETRRDVRLNAAEISRARALKMAERCHN